MTAIVPIAFSESWNDIRLNLKPAERSIDENQVHGLAGKGQSWDPCKLRRAQALWDEHAAFMDKLTADGFVELGGPLGEGDGDDALLVIDAADRETIISTLKDNPWIQAGILEVKAIRRWTIFLESRAR